MTAASVKWDDYWVAYERDNPDVASLARKLCGYQHPNLDPDTLITVNECVRGPRDTWVLPRHAAPLWSRWVSDAMLIRSHRKPEPVAFTDRESGDWLGFRSPEPSRQLVHSVRFADGSVFDAVNGWRKST